MDRRLGKHVFVEQLVAAGVRWVFGNPGTTEQAFIDVVQDHPELEYVLALHESVAVGAAEGYARASGEPAFVQLHTAPGLGNAMGMLSNASLGKTPLVVYVGDMPRASLFGEPALSGPIARMAEPVARWVCEVRFADEIPQALRRAFKVARHERGPVVIVVPADVMDEATEALVVAPSYVVAARESDSDALDVAADVLRGATSPALLVADEVATTGSVDAVAALAHLLGAPMLQGYVTEVCVPAGDLLDAGALPLFSPAGVQRALEPYDVVLGLGTEVLKQAFAGSALPLPADTALVHIGLDAWELGKNQPGLTIQGDPGRAAAGLHARLATAPDPEWSRRRQRVIRTLDGRRSVEHRPAGTTSGPISAAEAVAEIVAALPSGTVIADEAVSAQPELQRHLRAAPGEWFRSRGGGLGAGMSTPIGLALARPDSPVVALVGDGSAMYTITSLWTAAHHDVALTWVVLNNRGYRMLKLNTTAYLGDDSLGRPFVGADLVEPMIDFVGLARSLGVQGHRVTEATQIRSALGEAVRSRGPRLVEIVISGTVPEGKTP